MLPKYILITPARNEAAFIELTLESVVAQTILPVKWVIVSDGSTDGTDELVRKYAQEHPWIELVRTPERDSRHFAGKVAALNAGLAKVRDIEYEVIACMDADLSFNSNYFEFLLERLSQDSRLGLVGTPFRELSCQNYDYRFVSIEHVSGACQVFRRECFEAIGGYVPIKGGSIDHIAVITARMKGWKTRTFTETFCVHHRTIGTAQASAVRARFKYGVKDYAIGNAPLWEAFRTLYQMIRRPLLFGGLALGCGYVWAWLSRVERVMSPELVAFHRREQMLRLKKFLLKVSPFPSANLYNPTAQS
jgi:poly-beta-1,6-N-acetyl-D-glucosamine synthase